MGKGPLCRGPYFFDGYRFPNYQTEGGLGQPVVNAITGSIKA